MAGVSLTRSPHCTSANRRVFRVNRSKFSWHYLLWLMWLHQELSSIAAGVVGHHRFTLPTLLTGIPSYFLEHGHRHSTEAPPHHCRGAESPELCDTIPWHSEIMRTPPDESGSRCVDES